MTTVDHAQEYIDAGFVLCATRAANQKQAYGQGWQTAGRSAEHWVQHPEDGMGIVHGLSGTCSIDLDDLEHARIALEAVGVDVQELLNAPGSVQIVSGRDNRAKLLYRVPNGLPQNRHALNWPDEADTKKKHCILELRAGSVHDVLPPSVHPDTGKPYTWRGDWRALPELPDSLAKLWREWALAKSAMEDACPWHAEERQAPIGVSLPARPVNGAHNDVIGAYNRAYAVGQVLERHGYRKAGRRWLAPNSSTGIPGIVRLPDSEPLQIYSFHGSDVLCDGHAHDAFDVYRVLECNGDMTTAVAKAAEELGIAPVIDEQAKALAARVLEGTRRRAPRQRENAVLAQDAQPDTVAQIYQLPQKESLQTEQVQAVNPGMPPVPMICEIYKWIEAQLTHVKPDAVMQATLSFACAMTMRRYESQGYEPTAGFFGVVDTSTAGIDRLASRVRRLCVIVGELDILPGVDAPMSSQSSVYDKFEHCPRQYLAGTEYANLLMTARRQTSGAASSAMSAMQAVYDGDDFELSASRVGAKSRTRETRVVRSPTFSMLAIMAHMHLRVMASEREYARGTLQRMLLIPAGEAHLNDAAQHKPALPGGLMELLKRLVGAPAIGGDRDNPWLEPRAMRVCWDRETKTVVQAGYGRLMATVDAPERAAFRGVAVGYKKSALRLASALAAWANPEQPTLTPEIAAWAFQWALRCLQLTMPHVEMSSGQEEQDAMEAIIDVLMKQKKAISARDIAKGSRVFRKLSAQDKEEILHGMAECGMILAEKTNRTMKYLLPSVVRQ